MFPTERSRLGKSSKYILANLGHWRRGALRAGLDAGEEMCTKELRGGSARADQRTRPAPVSRGTCDWAHLALPGGLYKVNLRAPGLSKEAPGACGAVGGALFPGGGELAVRGGGWWGDHGGWA